MAEALGLPRDVEIGAKVLQVFGETFVAEVAVGNGLAAVSASNSVKL